MLKVPLSIGCYLDANANAKMKANSNIVNAPLTTYRIFPHIKICLNARGLESRVAQNAQLDSLSHAHLIMYGTDPECRLKSYGAYLTLASFMASF